MTKLYLPKYVLVCFIFLIFLTFCFYKTSFALIQPTAEAAIPSDLESVELIPSQSPKASNLTDLASSAKNLSEITSSVDDLGELSRLSHPQITPFNTPTCYLFTPVVSSQAQTCLETQPEESKESIVIADSPLPSPTLAIISASVFTSPKQEMFPELPSPAISPVKSGVGFLVDSLIGVAAFVAASIVVVAIYITRRTSGAKVLSNVKK